MVDVVYDDDPGRVLTKFPGGTRDPEDLDELATAIREFKEEAGLSLRPDATPILIWEERRNGHLKRFYLIYRKDCTGRLRTRMLKEKRSRIYRPRYVRARDILDIIDPSHRSASLAVLEHLSSAEDT